jgi:NitT/TauT family transport system permease protein
MSRLITQVGYPLAGVILILAAWALACWAGNLPTVVLPTPDKVFYAFVNRFDLLMSEGWVTLKETLYGFILAVVIGIPMAVAIANSRPLNLMFYPLLIGLQSVPKVALAPILLVWLGTGIESKLAIVWLVAFFPIIVDTVAGLRSTPRELLELAHSLRATPMQIFLKVQFPAALPFVITGAKVAITLAVIGAVIG